MGDSVKRGDSITFACEDVGLERGGRARRVD